MLTVEHVRRVLAPRYAVERQIGSGGNAVVFLAHDRDEDRAVAIKVLRPELAASVLAERFQREIALGRQLEHENVLRIFESGMLDGLLYFTMPYVEGETLRQRLVREENLSIEDTLAIARAVAAAIDYAHGQNIIHRDIKPANILLGRDGSVIVADFGVARAMTAAQTRDLTESGMVIGTPAYMSPEQASSARRIDKRTDVYSLGCVVYEMLAGEPPFTGPTTQAVIARACHEEPRALNVVRPSVTVEMDRAIGKALGKVPSDRFATAGEFVDALALAATRSRAKRLPVSLAAGVAGLLILLIGGYAVAAKLRDPPAAPSRMFVAIRPFKGSAESAPFGWLGAALETQLANALFEAPNLSLRSASALAPYASRNIPDDSLARLTGVDYFIDGQVIPSGDSVGVTVQLLDARTATVLAVETVRASVRTPPEQLLDSAVVQVRAALLPVIGQAVRARMWENAAGDSVAVALRYRAHERRWEGEALAGNEPRTAIARYREADSLLALSATRAPRWTEPRLARAALAARRAVAEHDTMPADTVRATLTKGIAAAESVLREDSSSAEALAYRGRLRWRLYLWGGDSIPTSVRDSAEADLRRAASATPPVAFAAQDLSEILFMEKSQFAEARELAERAYKLDAYQDETGLLINRLAMSSLHLGLDAEAAKWCGVGLRRYPNQPQHVACLLDVMAWGTEDARPDSAWTLYRKLVARSAKESVRWHYLLRVAAVYARANEKAEAEKLVAQVRKEMGDAHARRTYILPWEAGVYFRLGNARAGDSLFQELRKEYQEYADDRAKGFPLKGYLKPSR